MSAQNASRFVAFLFSAVIVSVFFLLPIKTFAVGSAADAMCNPVDVRCPCHVDWACQGQTCGCLQAGANMHMCTCTDTTNGGVTTGQCITANKCLGQSTSGAAGQAGGGLGMSQLLSALQGLMSALKGSGASGSGSGGTPTTGAGGCSTFYQTSVQGNPDPCSYYVPAAGDIPGFNFPTSTGTTPPGLTCTTFTPTSVVNNPDPCSYYVAAGGSTSTNDNTSTTTVNVVTSGPTTFSNILNNIVGIGGGGGDIEVKDTGATIYAGSADTRTNSGVAGFFGGNATNAQQAGGIIVRLCATRPWASSLLSVLIPPNFFDTLCKLRGYQVGPPPPPVVTTRPVQVNTYVAPKPVVTLTQTSTPQNYIPPQANIWAVPTAVPIGARTSVFWNSRGVKSCVVTSPDGNFSEASLAGAGSTVPIVATTVFTISCIAMDDSHVTNSVTVYLKI